MDRSGAPRPAWLREHHLQATRPAPPAAPPVPGALGPSRAHCWVQDPGADPGGAPGWCPAVVVRWRREPAGWSAQVAYVVAGDDPALVVAWVAAGALRPA